MAAQGPSPLLQPASTFQLRMAQAISVMSPQKRFMDLVISVCTISLFSPVFLLIAMLIWLEDRGPILFRQFRLSRNSKIFTVYKFRKFTVAGDESGPKVTLPDDQRYSRVGKVLERTKLNELPQLLNVVRGDMSIVGPRPEIPDFSYCFVGDFRQLLNFTPGIFGPSQTLFRNEVLLYEKDCDPERFYAEVLFPAKARIDIEYYSKATCYTDLIWIFRALFAVFLGCNSNTAGKNSTSSTDLNDYLIARSASQQSVESRNNREAQDESSNFGWW